MKHYGDICSLSGHTLPIVDVITGGSPCQDLSVAGRRAGLAGERSGLFMEQIRIIKEMRNESRRQLSAGGTDVDIRLVRPRYMVWENVPGAFSSNKGEDFRAVLEETAKVADEDAVIPGFEGGRWTPCGCILGNGWSIAWRVHDAQFWGVPQRRKRICLLADFNGESAGEILFELWRDTTGLLGKPPVLDIGAQSRSEVQSVAEGLHGDSAESCITGQDPAGNVGLCAPEAGRAISFQERAGKPGEGKGILIQDEHTGALSTLNNQAVCCLNDQGGSQMDVSLDKTGTLRAQEHGHQPIVFEPGAASRVGGYVYEDGVAGTVRANAGDNQQAVVYGISAHESNAMKSANPNSGIYEAETSRTLDNNGGNPACNQGGMIVLEGNESRESHRGNGFVEEETMYTLNTAEQHAVCVEVPLEVEVRKYPVDVDGLKRLLHEHRKPASEVVDILGCPVTKVEHWFRTDKYFAIPDPKYWLRLKEILGIETDAFDKSIMEFETKEGNFDTRNRIHMGEVAPTLSTQCRDLHCVPIENHPADSRIKICEDGVVQTLSGRMGTGGGNVPMIMETSDGEIAGTLDASYYKGCGERQGKERTVVMEAVCVGNGQVAQTRISDTVGTLNCMHDKQAVITYGLDRASFNQGKNAKYNFSVDEEVIGAQVAKGPGAVLPWMNSIVRRLTPMECERLQGFPDHWTDIGEWIDSAGKWHKDADSPRYKALGNSIALPFWEWLAKRIAEHYNTTPTQSLTMASLFDGISGFPLTFSRAGFEPVWSSEIEEFPIAVAKRHFPDC